MPDIQVQSGICTIPDVEVLKVGNWTSSNSGRVAITDDDLASIVAAARDMEIDRAPLKVGHVDPRFDGEPALGWLENVRAENGVLKADIHGAPAKMEALLRSAFRRRSAEINWQVKTPSGKQYRASLAGLALLGVQIPAVKGLADVLTRYSSPEHESASRVVTLDGESHEDNEAFADLYNEMGAMRAQLSMLSGIPPGPTRHNGPDDSTGDSMTDEEVRAALGLDASIPVTDTIRKLGEKAQTNPPVEDPPAPKPPVEEPPAPQPPVTEPPATVTLDRAAFEALQERIALGEQAHRALADQERDRELQAALSGGKIAPASVDSYRKLWDADPATTKALLAGLTPSFSTVTNFSGRVDAEGKQVDERGFTEDDWKQSGLTNLGSWMEGNK